MATCKDCLHYDACYIVEVYGVDDNENCKQFKNKADVVPRAEVAREIVEDVKTTLLDYHLQESKKYNKSLSKTKKQFDIETQRYRAVTDAIKFALKTIDEIEKKYPEDRK